MRALELLLARPRSTPKTARMITSSVSDCIERQQRERLADRPARRSRVGGLAHHLLVGPHPLAVEGRQHQLALAQVLGAVEQQHRALADHRPEHGVGLSGAQCSGRAAEDLLDELGLEDHHEAAGRRGVLNVTTSP